ncbi:MAG TPA: CDP-alcohol phosphatidyltransferase family protein [Ktedonobacteraceae bacterium]|nr:CDP-alcohol phosphatidyltransferase family protein [Ktedonobacteraceae bacterium]
MKQLKKKSGSIYSDVEELVLEPWQRMRQRFLSPIAFVLARLGISADMLSFASVVLGIGFFLYAPFQFTVAFWFLIASLVCDSLDGVEARLTGTNTMRGSFTDVFCDQLVVAFTVAGMAWKGLIHPALAVIFVSVYTSLVMFLVLHRLLRVSSFGVVRPSRMLLYAAIALYFFFHIDLLNYLLLVYLLTLSLVFLSFWRLRKAL